MMRVLAILVVFFSATIYASMFSINDASVIGIAENEWVRLSFLLDDLSNIKGDTSNILDQIKDMMTADIVMIIEDFNGNEHRLEGREAVIAFLRQDVERGTSDAVRTPSPAAVERISDGTVHLRARLSIYQTLSDGTKQHLLRDSKMEFSTTEYRFSKSHVKTALAGLTY